MKKATVNKIFSLIYNIFVTALLLGFVIVSLYILQNIFLATKNASIGTGQNPGPIDTLVSIQSNTLAIVSIAAAWISIVVGLVTFYQNKRNEINQRIIDENLAESETLKQAITNIFSLVAVRQFNDEYTFGSNRIVLSELQNKADISDNQQFIYLTLAEMNHYENTLVECTNNVAAEKNYNNLKDSALKIINSYNVSAAIKHLAYMKAVFALYRIVRIKEPHSPLSAKDDILECQRLLSNDVLLWSQFKSLNPNTDDAYGHLANLRGLVNLWNARIIRKCTPGNQVTLKEAQSLFEQAEENFKDAIKSAEAHQTPKDRLIKFYNHQVVAKLNSVFAMQESASIKNDEQAWDKCKKKCDDIDSCINDMKKISNTYSKIFVNEANNLSTKLEIIFKVFSLEKLFEKLDDPAQIDGLKTDTNFINLTNSILQSHNELRKCIEQSNVIADTYYRFALMGLLYKLLNGSTSEVNNECLIRGILDCIYFSCKHSGTTDLLKTNTTLSFEKMNGFSYDDTQAAKDHNCIVLTDNDIWKYATVATLTIAEGLFSYMQKISYPIDPIDYSTLIGLIQKERVSRNSIDILNPTSDIKTQKPFTIGAS